MLLDRSTAGPGPRGAASASGHSGSARGGGAPYRFSGTRFRFPATGEMVMLIYEIPQYTCSSGLVHTTSPFSSSVSSAAASTSSADGVGKDEAAMR